jgi:hypothetical protein
LSHSLREVKEMASNPEPGRKQIREVMFRAGFSRHLTTDATDPKGSYSEVWTHNDGTVATFDWGGADDGGVSEGTEVMVGAGV